MPYNQYITATDARKNFFALLEKVKKTPQPVNITVNGIPEAVMMGKEDYDAWMETIDILSDPELMASIRQGEKDIKAGRYKSWDKVKKELGLEDDYILADKGKKTYVSDTTKQKSRKRIKKTR